ncbi:MAG: hypothetical protein J0653_00390, partial [Deltaproteobacteria bacterium]|nr:hypothetical protein [Deltaproteobacteria bacterium]
MSGQRWLVYPSHTSITIKSKRNDAQLKMISHAQTMERYFTSNSSYQNGNAYSPLDPAASIFIPTRRH